MFLIHNLIFLFQNMLDWIQRTFSLWKFQTKENFNKNCSIILQILAFKTLWIFVKSLLQTHILFGYWYYPCIRNSLHFRNNLLEAIWKLIMAIDDKVRDEKQQYDINWEVAKILALSSRKIYEYEYLKCE